MRFSYNKSQAPLVWSEEERVQFYAEKRQLSSRVTGLDIDKITFARELTGFRYNYTGALANEKKASEALKKLRAFFE